MPLHENTGPRGLYDPAFEHDACGVGLVCKIDGTPSHDVVRRGLKVLLDLDHRGACGCDERTGDGAGIMTQVPHTFFRAKRAEHGIRLPEPGAYGVGMVFMPNDPAQQKVCKMHVEDAVRGEGQVLLGWREVPTHNETIGAAARAMEPAIWQVFVGRGADVADQMAFERKLYVIRKVFQNTVYALGLTEKDCCYVPSLSSRTLVYKGMLTPEQVPAYFPDLIDPAMESALAMVHSRFSTNTFPKWPLAQPFRFLCHNGEINTLRGNRNQMKAGEAMFHSKRFGDDTKKLLPIIREGGSDSMALDNALELLYFTGRSLPHAMMMLVPEAWEHNPAMPDQKRAFYQYHSNLMEPWDGPATLPFTDGRYVGAVLDRNGLRPSRYTITKDGYAILASETGVGDVHPSNVLEKGRLQPGRMFLVDLEEGRVISDEEIKSTISRRKPYRKWLDDNVMTLHRLPRPASTPRIRPEARRTKQRMFGYTLEDLRLLLAPMGQNAKEALGSMGNDTPLAVLSDRPRLLYDYFKQLFAQVTNPPLDAIREELVTSLYARVGKEGNLFDPQPGSCRTVHLDTPVITDEELARLVGIDGPGGIGDFRTAVLPALFAVADGGDGLRRALDGLCDAASDAIAAGAGILVVSDRGSDERMAPIPSLLAVSAVHQHLVRERTRTRVGLVSESGDAREVHHLCLHLGYGANAVNPYLALETIEHMATEGLHGLDRSVGVEAAQRNYVKAACAGVLKVTVTFEDGRTQEVEADGCSLLK